MSTTPVLAESSAGIEFASATEKVTAAKVEALGPQVEGEARHVCGDCQRRPGALRELGRSQYAAAMGFRRG